MTGGRNPAIMLFRKKTVGIGYTLCHYIYIRSEIMISIEKAYRIANSFFVENDYVGVYEVRENEDSWLFVPQCKSACYGVANVCVPKNGDEPYVFSTTDADGAVMWERGKEGKRFL